MKARDGRSVSVELEVPFHDVDALRIVWHGHYLKYLEIARTRLLRSCGLDAADVVPLGYGFLVIEAKCRYVAPLRYGDRFVVQAWFGDIDHRILIHYELTTVPDGRRVARGHTVLTTVDATGTMQLVTPAPIRQRLA